MTKHTNKHMNKCQGLTKAGKRCKKKCRHDDFCHMHHFQCLSDTDISVFTSFPNDIKGIIMRKYWCEQYYRSVKKIKKANKERRKMLFRKYRYWTEVFETQAYAFFDYIRTINYFNYTVEEEHLRLWRLRKTLFDIYYLEGLMRVMISWSSYWNLHMDRLHRRYDSDHPEQTN